MRTDELGGIAASYRRRKVGRDRNVEGVRTGFRQCLHAKHMNAAPTESGSSWSASSCSGDEENQILACKAQWAKETELRNNARSCWSVKKRKKPSVQLEERREEAEPEEECQIDVDSGADIRKKLDQRRKET